MYSEAGLMFPYFQSFSQEEFFRFLTPDLPLEIMVQTSTISDYDLGGEGDLFKAPEPIIEKPTISINPMIAAISMITCGEDICPQTLEITNLESLRNEQLLSEIFYECNKDLLAKDAIETPNSEILEIKLPTVGTIDSSVPEGELFSEGSFLKSLSSGCLSSIEGVHRAMMRPTFMDLPKEDIEAVYGLRRAFSDGDVKTLANNNGNLVPSPHGLPPYHISCSSEDRMQKLSRYRDKKSKRNFGRKIKYACRKALADSQPRVRGRFAKTDESK